MLNICLTLQLSKELIGCIPDLQTGESGITHLTIMIPHELEGFYHRLEFKKPNNEKVCSEFLKEFVDGEGHRKFSIDLTNSLLTIPGEYTMEYVGVKDTSTFHSRGFKFKVIESIGASEEILKPFEDPLGAFQKQIDYALAELDKTQKQLEENNELLETVGKENLQNIGVALQDIQQQIVNLQNSKVSNEELNTKLNEIQQQINNINASFENAIQAINEHEEAQTQQLNNLENNKVDKVEGKGLSANDFTNEEKEKLAGLSNYDDTEIKELANALTSNLQQQINAKQDKLTAGEGIIIIDGIISISYANGDEEVF